MLISGLSVPLDPESEADDQVTLIYCLFLPFQLYSGFGWLTIPAVVVCLPLFQR
jgi:hypothetical protein